MNIKCVQKPATQKILDWVKSLKKHDEVFTLQEVFQKHNFSNGGWARMVIISRCSERVLKVGCRIYVGHPKAIEALKKQVK